MLLQTTLTTAISKYYTVHAHGHYLFEITVSTRIDFWRKICKKNVTSVFIYLRCKHAS
jgi:hypothetical protein